MIEQFPDDGEIEGAAGEIVVTIPQGAEGTRLDVLLAREVAAVSRTRLKSLIRDGHVLVGGRKIVEPKYRVNVGDRVRLRLPPAVAAAPAAEAMELAIVHEDGDLIVIDKPAGLVVHPAPGNASGTLVNALLAHCGASLSGIGGVRRPGIVHRLDKDTSGLMVVAKNDRAHRALAAQFADHGRSGPLERAYTALVWEAPPRPAGTIEASLARSPGNRLKQAVSRSAKARRAVTHYRVREVFRGGGEREGTILAAAVDCRLETGRTHQIRVHMAHIGCPLMGDRIYGAHFLSKQDRLARIDNDAHVAISRLRRQALHAHRLGFAHPADGRLLLFESPLPQDMRQIVAALGGMQAGGRRTQPAGGDRENGARQG